jgi:hypothetical protein
VTETVSATVPHEADTVGVASVLGLSLAEARTLLRQRGLRVEALERDPEVGILLPLVGGNGPRGEVLRHNLDPHTEVRAGRFVRLVLATPEPSSGCDPSYPDVCIPPYPPDLDCSQVGYTNIRVVASDPHGLDNGGTPGLGCET